MKSSWKAFVSFFLQSLQFRSGSARSFNTQYGHLSPESSADEAGEEDEVEEEARAHQGQQKDVLVQEQQKEEKVRGRPERRKTQRIDYNQIDEAEEERKRLEKELEELNRQQEDGIRKHDEEKKKVQDENDRQSVILEMIGGLKPPSGSRARSVPRGRRREKVVAEVSGMREII